MSKDRRAPGYMTEDLDLQITSDFPRYTSRTERAVDYLTITRTADGAPIGFLYANDDDRAAGWCPVPAAGSTGMHLATPWVHALGRAARRGLAPTAALDELAGTSDDVTRASPSRARVPGLDALRALAG